MKRSRKVAVMAASLAGLSIVIAACGGDDVADTRVAPVDAAAHTDAVSERGIDAAEITLRPDLCMNLAFGTDAVPEGAIEGDAPQPLGGKIPAGTYDLTELDVYTGVSDAGAASDGGEDIPHSNLTGKSAKATIIVTEFAMQVIDARAASEAAGLGAPQSHATLYRVVGTALVETEVCPATKLPVSMSYSAVGGGLAIFVDATHRELYVRRP